VEIGATIGEHQNGPPPSVNYFNTFNPYIYMKVKGMIKQGNMINLYYLNFLGMVMLRPALVTLGGGA
jgi:hypothetical protein